jgi:formate/nitrite transporter
VGFVIIVLLGLELVTGSFALLPLAAMEGKTTTSRVMANFAWVFLGNLLGSLVYAGLLWISLSMAGQMAAGALGDKIATIAVAKTTAYAAHGGAGMLTVFTKAILCNWMVCLGVVMAMTSSSTIGKIAAAWLPIFIFFAQGYEHAVVNMFVVPAGIFFGAKVSLADWWVWNQIPVTLGNLVGGLLFTGLALYATYKPAASKEPLVAKTSAPLPEEATA